MPSTAACLPPVNSYTASVLPGGEVLPTAHILMPSAHCLVPSACYRRLPILHILPTAYCLVLDACYVLYIYTRTRTENKAAVAAG